MMCSRCGHSGIPYEYHGIQFDGLTAYKGERLCHSCTDAAMDADGINITLINPRNGDTDVQNTNDMRGKASTNGRWK